MTSVTQIFEFLMGMMNRLVLLIIGIALLGFLFGILRYLKSYNNEKERNASSKYIVYGLLSLLVMTSLWGFVYLLGNSFGIKIGSQNNGDFTKNIDGTTESNPFANPPSDSVDSGIPEIDVTNPNPENKSNNFWNNVSHLFGND